MENLLDIELVEKYNPNHDQRGRFTSYGSATSFTIRTQDSKYQFEAEKGKAKEAIRTGARGASKVNPNDPEYQKKVADGEARIRAVLGEDTKVSLTGMDGELIEGTVANIEKTVAKFPMMKDAVSMVEVHSIEDEHLLAGSRAMAYCAGSKLVLNAGYYGNADFFNKAYANGQKNQSHPEGTDVHSVVVHEMGHAIDNLVSRNVSGHGFLLNVSDDIWDTDIKKIRKKTGGPVKRSEMAEGLSSYGASHPHEYFAEAFSEVVCSSKPRAKAKSIVRRFTTQYNKAVDTVNKYDRKNYEKI